METLIQSGPNSTPCCRITMIWITLVSRYLQKWPELHPWKMSHSCTKQEMVWNTPTQSCHCAHSYELDKFQFIFFKDGSNWHRQTLVWCGRLCLWKNQWGWSIICRETVCQGGCQSPGGKAQEDTACTLGPAPGPLHGTHVPTTSSSLINRALLIMLCKW
jgi:hypothetical protein